MSQDVKRAEKVRRLQDDLEAGNAAGVAQDIAQILNEVEQMDRPTYAALYDRVFDALRKHADEG